LKGLNDRIRATSTALDNFGGTIEIVDGRLSTLGGTVKTTTGHFKALNRSLGAKAQVKTPKSTAPEIEVKPNKKDEGTVSVITRLNRALLVTVGRLEAFSKKLQNCDPCPQVAAAAGEQAAKAAQQTAQGFNQAATSLNKNVKATTEKVGEAGKAAEPVKTQFDLLKEKTKKLKDSFGFLYQIIDDFYSLQRRGISGSKDLAGMYANAVKAGMSLAEYTEMLEENQAVVARKGSFEEFDKSISKTSKELGSLGIFGPAARKLSASMETAATTVGIPQAQMADATTAQVKLFKQLRKSTLMTSDAFKALVEDISNNTNVQEELLGLAPAERQARMDDIMHTATLGQQMGLTANTSKQLTDALLAQRRATAKDRFKAAGIIRQAGSMTGMNAQDTEELARLAQKKNKTEEENARLTELHGQMQERLQGMQNSGDVGAQNIADQINEAIQGSSQRDVAEVAGKAQLQKQSGDVVNSRMGQETGPLAQMMGNIMTTLTGITKNPLYDAAKQFAELIAGSVAQVLFLRKIAKNTDGLVPATGKEEKGGLLDIFKKKETTPTTPKTPPPTGPTPTTTVGGKPIVTGGIPKPLPTVPGAGVPKGMTLPMPNMPKGVPMAGALGKLPGLGKVATLAEAAITGDISTVATTLMETVIGSVATTAPAAIAGEGAVVAAGGGMATAAQGIASTLFGSLSSVLGLGMIVSAVWGALDELFTGNLAAAGAGTVAKEVDMSKKGWIWDMGQMVSDKINGMIIGAFHGIGAAVTGGLDFLLKGIGLDTEELLGGTLTNMFDRTFTEIQVAWRSTKAAFWDFLTSLVPSWAPDFIKNTFKGNADAAKEEVKTGEATLKTLQEDGKATLSSIGEANQQAAADAKKQGKKLSGTVANSTKELLAQAHGAVAAAQAPLIAQAKKDQDAKTEATPAVQATPVKPEDSLTPGETVMAKATPVQATPVSPNAALATPGQQGRQKVTLPEVNKPQVEEDTDETKKKGMTVVGMKEALELLKKQLEVAQKMLDATTAKEDTQPGFLRSVLPTFPDTAELTRRAV
jgi:hypothetical protein